MCDIKGCDRQGCLQQLYDENGFEYVDIVLCKHHIDQLIKRSKRNIQ